VRTISHDGGPIKGNAIIKMKSRPVVAGHPRCKEQRRGPGQNSIWEEGMSLKEAKLERGGRVSYLRKSTQGDPGKPD